MGLFDNLFGGGNKTEPTPKPKKKTAPPPEISIDGSAGIRPEIVAAIAAGIYCAMDDTNLSAELLAAITAAVVHHAGGAHAVKIKRTSNAWAMSGRQKLMDVRQFS